jgi:hypothetical protein
MFAGLSKQYKKGWAIEQIISKNYHIVFTYSAKYVKIIENWHGNL